MKKNSQAPKHRSRTGRVIARIINIPMWIDWERMKSISWYLWSGFKKFFVPQKNISKESFKEIQHRLHLNDSDLMARQIGLLRLSKLMLCGAILLFGYTIYLFADGGWRGGVVGLIVTAIAIVLAFRYHFWYFLIKERKLGCTFQEWYKQGLMGEKP